MGRIPLPLGNELRQTGRRPGTTRGTINALIAVKHRIAVRAVRLGWFAGPLDMRQALDVGIERMDKVVLLIQTTTEFRADALQITGGEVRYIPVVFLRLDNRIEIPAIGNINHDRAKIGTVNGNIGFIQKRWHVGQLDRFDVFTDLIVFGDHQACRGFKPQAPRCFGFYQAFFNRHGDGPDGAMAAHRKAARRFNKQYCNIIIIGRRIIEDRSRHHVMTTRLKHQPGADPVIFGQKMRPLFKHGRTVKFGSAAGNQTHRVAASMTINTKETVFRHGWGLLETIDTIGRHIDRGFFPAHKIGNQTPGGCCHGQAKVPVPKGEKDVLMIGAFGNDRF